MTGEKRRLEQSRPTDTLQTSQNSTHTFLNLRLEPIISTSLIEVLDLFSHSASICASVPSTPPPIYEPPPPSYSSGDSVSLSSVTSLDLGQPAVSLVDSDAISVVTVDSCFYAGSDDGAGSRSSIYSFIPSGGLASRLQNELVLSVIMYEFLTHRPSLSRTPSRDTVMTSN
ncbi:hypothetical protein IWW36_002999 [Coemansia brasiliensis]|uniref:Uncharacterized protein n=1 Tax=Coemansia brasiliensis TaxID=2650707 RepID=A0A9W8M0G9_9FUNG|nr:hypothetical protein IWW36_002999 [Coemansia brasiliensis]